MIQAIVMPKFGQTVEESSIQQWLKQEGDSVSNGEILFEIETDKAVLEVPSFSEGTLLKILVPEGSTVPVLTTVAYVGDPGEKIPEPEAPPPAARQGREVATAESSAAAAPRSKPQAARRAARLPAERTHSAREEPTAAPAPEPGPARFKISPRAAKLARQSAIDPTPIQGTGPGGRVVEKDVTAYLEASGYSRIRIAPAAKRLAVQESVDILLLDGAGDAGRIRVSDVERAIAEKPKPMSRMRRTIARRMTESFTTTPHFYVTVAVDMTELVSLAAELKAQGATYKINGFLLKAVALTLLEFPALNSTTDGKQVRWHGRVHLGLAVALEDGLVVPVIRDADRLSLADLHRRAAELAAKARSGKLGPGELGGSTFTISNMGMLDVENFTAIINPGESAILAVSSVVKQPVVRDDQVVVRSIMKMTVSADHRIVDGALAARFANATKHKLEDMSVWRSLL